MRFAVKIRRGDRSVLTEEECIFVSDGGVKWVSVLDAFVGWVVPGTQAGFSADPAIAHSDVEAGMPQQFGRNGLIQPYITHAQRRFDPVAEHARADQPDYAHIDKPLLFMEQQFVRVAELELQQAFVWTIV